MTVHLQRAPADEPVFRFLDRKHAEGKPYYVYMTAVGNKFLRRYYGKVPQSGRAGTRRYGFHRPAPHGATACNRTYQVGAFAAAFYVALFLYLLPVNFSPVKPASGLDFLLYKKNHRQCRWYQKALAMHRKNILL